MDFSRSFLFNYGYGLIVPDFSVWIVEWRISP